MNSRCFGDSELCTSTIGFGTWPIGGARYGAVDDDEARTAIRAALDARITCFDTAPSYGHGHAEALLGETLGTRRKDVLIATKGGMLWDEKSFVLGQDSSRGHLERGLEESLARLRTDYVDIFMIHWPDGTTPLPDVASSLEYLIDTGKARAVGVSNFTNQQLCEISDAMSTHPITTEQVGYSLLDRRWANETFATCVERKIGVMAYGPLAHGLLTGSLDRTSTFDATDWRAAGVIFGQPLLTPENRQTNLGVFEQLRSFAVDRSMTLPQLATAWVLTNEAVTVALIGARNGQEITEAVGAAAITLSEHDLAAIETIMAGAVGMTDELPAGGTSKATQKQGA